MCLFISFCLRKSILFLAIFRIRRHEYIFSGSMVRILFTPVCLLYIITQSDTEYENCGENLLQREICMLRATFMYVFSRRDSFQGYVREIKKKNSELYFSIRCVCLEVLVFSATASSLCLIHRLSNISFKTVNIVSNRGKYWSGNYIEDKVLKSRHYYGWIMIFGTVVSTSTFN